MTPDEREIHELHSHWIRAVNAGDLARLLTLTTADVVFLNPGRAPVDRDGFSVSFAGAHRTVQIHCSSELEEVVVVGDVAYTRSRDALSVKPRESDVTTQLTGYRITLYRRQLDGHWLLARDAHTLTPTQK